MPLASQVDMLADKIFGGGIGSEKMLYSVNMVQVLSERRLTPVIVNPPEQNPFSQ
jgi:hypothetical protein